MYMYFKFERTRPGAYYCNYRHGYQAILVKMDGMWHGLIRLVTSGNYVQGTTVSERTLKEAKAALSQKANNIMVETVNLLTRKPIKVSIATPVQCDPSTETYHNM